MEAYLQPSQIINWQHPDVLALAGELAQPYETMTEIAKACFEWVRDQIRHSYDYQLNPVTCAASEVLEHRTGYCYAKSHLLAALLRANQIPTGFCYQRLSVNDQGPPYSLHGFNAIYLPRIGWYRVDARGNRDGASPVNAQFIPPQEQLAYPIRLPGEAEFEPIFTEPLPVVVKALQRYQTWDELLSHLPDVPLDQAEDYSLVPRVKVDL
jgi:hypothetical protein